MLPTLTPLQYLVLHLLFVGPQSGLQLRRTLRSLGVKQSRPAFSQLMTRLIEANCVDRQSTTRDTETQRVHFRRYEITDVGVAQWTAARKFYLNLAPPSADLLPVQTEEGQLAVYDPKVRNQVILDRVHNVVKRYALSVLDDMRSRS